MERAPPYSGLAGDRSPYARQVSMARYTRGQVLLHRLAPSVWGLLVDC